MSENALQRIEPMPASPSVEGMITLAIEKGATVETLERLMAIRREVRAEQAKEAYDRAMAAFQAECPIIKKTKAVSTNSGKVAYKYAPIESIVEQVKELLRAHGFSYSTKMELHERGVKSTVKVTHEGGHSEESPMEVPFGEKTQIMSQSQVAAAATTFAKRYAFLNAFGILTGDEDIDGHTDSVKEPPKDNANARQTTAKVPHGTTPTQKPAKPTQATEPANEDQRVRWVKQLKTIEAKAEAYGYANGILLPPSGPDSDQTPGEPVECWPLSHTPSTKAQAERMFAEIQAFGGAESPPGEPESGFDGAGDQNAANEAADASGSDLSGPEQSDDGVETITGKLEAVSVKEGKTSNGKKWTKYGLKINGEWINSFSNTLGKLAQQDKGLMVRIQFKRGDKGCDLVGIERANPA